jgi:hypothetical protein
MAFYGYVTIYYKYALPQMKEFTEMDIRATL